MSRRWVLVLAILGSCGGSTVDVAGDYSLAIVSGQNGCGFPNWTVGNTAQNIPFTITQQGDSITGTVGGGVGSYLNLVFGEDTFVGTISGDAVQMTLTGMRAGSQGACAYTVNAHATGIASGDFISGQIEYVPATNGSPDCGLLASCSSVQSFNGARPPTP